MDNWTLAWRSGLDMKIGPVDHVGYLDEISTFMVMEVRRGCY